MEREARKVLKVKCTPYPLPLLLLVPFFLRLCLCFGFGCLSFAFFFLFLLLLLLLLTVSQHLNTSLGHWVGANGSDTNNISGDFNFQFVVIKFLYIILHTFFYVFRESVRGWGGNANKMCRDFTNISNWFWFSILFAANFAQKQL